MTCNCCSGNVSPSSRHSLPSSVSSCGSSYPSNLVYTTANCSPSTCQLESSLNTGCRETCIESSSCQRSCVVSSTCPKPSSCQRSCVVSSTCPKSCYYPRSSTSCSPCQGAYAGPLGFGPSSFHSLDCGSSRYYIVDCGPSGFEHLYYGASGFPSQSYGSKFCYPTHLPPSTYQPYYKPTCGNILHGFYC